MDILGRVKRLELAWGSGPCRVCGGRGPIIFSWIMEGQDAPEREGCPGCGAIRHVVVRFTRSPNLGLPPEDANELGQLYA